MKGHAKIRKDIVPFHSKYIPTTIIYFSRMKQVVNPKLVLLVPTSNVTCHWNK